MILTACLALVATTSGLLLAIHLLAAEHSAAHDSHDCTVCQQLLVTSKKAAIAPGAELTQNTPVHYNDVPAFFKHVENRHARICRPRGPPCSYPRQPVV